MMLYAAKLNLWFFSDFSGALFMRRYAWVILVPSALVQGVSFKLR